MRRSGQVRVTKLMALGGVIVALGVVAGCGDDSDDSGGPFPGLETLGLA